MNALHVAGGLAVANFIEKEQHDRTHKRTCEKLAAMGYDLDKLSPSEVETYHVQYEQSWQEISSDDNSAEWRLWAVAIVLFIVNVVYLSATKESTMLELTVTWAPVAFVVWFVWRLFRRL